MNPTLVVTFLRQRMTSPMRVILLLLVFGVPLTMVTVTRTLTPLAGVAAQIVLIFAAGAIGQDVSSGVLQLTFARPVSRPSYVVSRWLAASFATTALVLVQALIGSLIMVSRAAPVNPVDVARIVVENAVLAFAVAAILMALSACFSGLGDIGVLFLLSVCSQLLGALAGQFHWPAVGPIAGFVSDLLFPKVDLRWVFGQGAIVWTQLLSWMSTLSLGLSLAIWRLNRRELSYAAD